MKPYDYQLRHDEDGRIVEKVETVAGESATWAYTYDKRGRLLRASLDGRLVCECYYDRQGRRVRDIFPATAGNLYRDYGYTVDNRLMQAGNNGYTHDTNGFRALWNHGGTYTLYEYSPDYRLLSAEIEGQDIRFSFDHDDNGQRAVKYCNEHPIEAYLWLDFTRLAAFHDGEHLWEFGYREEERVPAFMRRDDGITLGLYYDQVGSLRVVADQNGNVIKEVLCDPFGGIIVDTLPELRIPIGFAGGLHDPDLGFVRFGWRDYDPFTSRWTAPDPLGDAGGDPDWYGYCLDDPVNMVDPLGLFGFGPGGYDYDGSKWDKGDAEDKGGDKPSGHGNGGWGFGKGGHDFPGGARDKSDEDKGGSDSRGGNGSRWGNSVLGGPLNQTAVPKRREAPKESDAEPEEDKGSPAYQRHKRLFGSFWEGYKDQHEQEKAEQEATTTAMAQGKADETESEPDDIFSIGVEMNNRRKQAVEAEKERDERDRLSRQQDIARSKRNPNPTIAPDLVKDGEVGIDYTNAPRTYGDEHGNRTPPSYKPVTSYVPGLDWFFAPFHTQKTIKEKLTEYKNDFTYEEDTELRDAIQEQIDKYHKGKAFGDGIGKWDEEVVNRLINNAYDSIGRDRPKR